MDEQPWFKNGLRFTCSGCGDCCTGAPGFVWVNREEIEDLARQVKLTAAEFETQYVRKVGIRKSLVEFENGDCVFFDANTRKCSVYDARPRQCKTWPFWQSNTVTEEAWKQTCEVCPGSGRGKLHSVDKILHQISIVKL
jgi:Fe-S-cluster containining protein